MHVFSAQKHFFSRNSLVQNSDLVANVTTYEIQSTKKKYDFPGIFQCFIFSPSF